jgi:hypothetical protein
MIFKMVVTMTMAMMMMMMMTRTAAVSVQFFLVHVQILGLVDSVSSLSAPDGPVSMELVWR